MYAQPIAMLNVTAKQPHANAKESWVVRLNVKILNLKLNNIEEKTSAVGSESGELARNILKIIIRFSNKHAHLIQQIEEL